MSRIEMQSQDVVEWQDPRKAKGMAKRKHKRRS
jgi:hypothetical protein